MLVGEDGKPITVEKIEEEEKKEEERKVAEAIQHTYKAGGFEITIGGTPEAVLLQTLREKRNSVEQHVMMQGRAQNVDPMIASAAAKQESSKITHPFVGEHCALAVLMCLSREIEYRDRVIADLSKRLDALDGKTTDLEHPYPIPTPAEKPEV